MSTMDELIRVAKPLGESIHIGEGPEISIRNSKELGEQIEVLGRVFVE